MIQGFRVARVGVLMAVVFSGCSSQDFGRPMGASLTDVLNSDRTPPAGNSAEIAAQRAEQLTRALSAWDSQRGDSELDYRIGPDDVLEIAVLALEQPGEFTTLTRTIARDGTVDLPLIGPLPVTDLNVAQATSRIAETYRNSYLKNPRVTVVVKEYRSQPIVVTGAVTTPGIVYLRHNSSTVLEVLSMAQGLSALAGDKLLIVRKRATAGGDEASAPTPPPATPASPEAADDEAVLTEQAEAELAAAEARLVAAAGAAEADEALIPSDDDETENGNDEKPEPEEDARADAEDGEDSEATPPLAEAGTPMPETGPQMIEVDLDALLKTGDMRMNITIQGGDIVTIPPSVTEYIYVLGYVNSPGAYALKGQPRISALKAVALANGLSPTARAGNSLLIVEDERRRKVTPVNLPAIARGATPPVYMQPGDTLMVGSSAFAKMGEFIKPTVSAGASYSPVP